MNGIINTSSNIIGKLLNKISALKPEVFIFWTTTIFYFFLWFLNPGNKIIAFGFIFLILLYYLKFKKIKTSLLFAYIASTIIYTGKTYPIQLLPPGILIEEIFPQGYFVNLVISPSHVLSFIMFIILLREFFTKQKSKILAKLKTVDFLLISFFFWNIISDLISSKMPDLSFAFDILSLPGLILYLYLRFIVKIDKKFWLTLAFLFSALVVFESFISFLQFMTKSPIYKNIEYQVSIEYFGKTVDETEFTFRPVGTFDHANSLGIWLSSSLIFLITFLLERPKTIFLITCLMGFTALIMTLSRSSWIGFFTGFVFLLYILKKTLISKKFLDKHIPKKIILFTPIFIWLIIFFVLPRIEKSFYSFGTNAGGGYFRKIQIEDALEIIKTNPLFGIGNAMAVYGGISLDLYTIAASLPLEVHNWYLQLCLENGIPSLILFIFFVLLTIRSFLYKYKNQKNSPIFFGIIASIISLFIAGLFQPYLNENFILLTLGALSSGIIENNHGKTY